MKYAAFILATSLISTPALADFRVTSQDIRDGEMMASEQVYNGFGCEGDNLSPQLSWQDAPQGTKSFAITAYDPDAPTGSGWWHWVAFNIPASVNSIDTGASGSNMPEGVTESRTDYGSTGFGGACPPAGDDAHRYQFTVFALNTETLDLPADSSGALVGFYLHAHALGKARLEGLYQR
ncbi:MAG: YbhB/YbcL family Raf kinase inhibitor-like protein [Oceanospirillaceae bacterium]|nr:YbhB/YbcL family Raf kinase inhibitor-like protein [Oceanospirillaceae bacterium]MBT10460.1 YbhB/YbcL family Raf kinase inhibitor-like protein [Oceanospirillaceae bacterium]|tara:strand:+ start:31369 stop:31905 length:537 start_codon:yes stop_codon:yes gene_type:complete